MNSSFQCLATMTGIDTCYKDFSCTDTVIRLENEITRLNNMHTLWKNNETALTEAIKTCVSSESETVLSSLKHDLEQTRKRLSSIKTQLQTTDSKIETIQFFKEIIDTIEAARIGGQIANVIHLHNTISFLNPEGNQLRNKAQNDPIEFIDKSLEYDVKILDNFIGEVAGLEDELSIHCGECDHLLQTTQIAKYITLKDEENRKLKSIQQLFDFYLAPTTLIDYKCTKCQCKQNILAWHKLRMKANNLMLRVPRIDENGNRNKKEYIVNSTLNVAGQQTNFAGELDHHGSCIRYGHFTFTRAGNKKDIRINDHKITHMNKPEIRTNSNCYIVIYQK